MRTTRILAATVAAALAVGALVAAPLAAEAAVVNPSNGVVGALDSVKPEGLNRVVVTGWASVDVNYDNATKVAVYVDSTRTASLPANLIRPDVARYLDTYGFQKHYGFTGGITVPPGNHVVRIYALTKDGTNPLIGSQAISIPASPRFHIDSIKAVCPAAGSTAPRIKIVGWHFDPDDLGHVGFVDVYRTTTSGAVTGARYSNSVDRPDVRKSYQLRTNGTGFSIVSTVADVTTVRLFAINVGLGSNRLMKTIDVASVAPAPGC